MKDQLQSRMQWKRIATLAVIAALLSVFAIPASSEAQGNEAVQPARVQSAHQPDGQRLTVNNRNGAYPVVAAWHYTSTINGRTYYRPGVEFCVFKASNDVKIGCTRTNNSSRLSEQAFVNVPELGSYYVSFDGQVVLRDNPITIPWVDPSTGLFQFWNRVTVSGVRCFGQTPTVIGTPQVENLRGTQGRDVVFLGAGDDVYRGLGGNDFVCGGNGNDVIVGGDGVDRLRGGRGGDVLRGDAGNDILVGGPHRDVLIGGAGNDQCRGTGDILRTC